MTSAPSAHHLTPQSVVRPRMMPIGWGQFSSNSELREANSGQSLGGGHFSTQFTMVPGRLAPPDLAKDKPGFQRLHRMPIITDANYRKDLLRRIAETGPLGHGSQFCGECSRPPYSAPQATCANCRVRGELGRLGPISTDVWPNSPRFGLGTNESGPNSAKNSTKVGPRVRSDLTRARVPDVDTRFGPALGQLRSHLAPKNRPNLARN